MKYFPLFVSLMFAYQVGAQVVGPNPDPDPTCPECVPGPTIGPDLPCKLKSIRCISDMRSVKRIPNVCPPPRECKNNQCVCPWLEDGQCRCIDPPSYGQACTTVCKKPFVCMVSPRRGRRIKRCQCPRGLQYDRRSRKCYKKCGGKNEVFNSCQKPSCIATCENPFPMPLCIKTARRGCLAGCFCKNGLVRNKVNGECVAPSTCPGPLVPICKENEMKVKNRCVPMNNADENEWPWMASISAGGFKCTGVLIHHNLVLTDRNCVCTAKGFIKGQETCAQFRRGVRYLSDIKVTVGQYRRNQPDKDEVTSVALEVRVHPDGLNLALIKIASVTPSAGRQVVPLVASADPRPGQAAVVTGWFSDIYPSQVNDGRMVNILKEVTVQVAGKCKGNLICVHKAGDIYKDLCFGHAGMPLFVMDMTGKWSLSGIGNGIIRKGQCSTFTSVAINNNNKPPTTWINSTAKRPDAERICHGSNDPHYVSFDKTKFDYHGTCQFIMTQPCDEQAKAALAQHGIPHFEVFAQNKKCSPHQHQHRADGWWPACVSKIGLRFPDQAFEVVLDGGSASVNGGPIFLPYFQILPGGFFVEIAVDPNVPQQINIQTSFGLTVYLSDAKRKEKKAVILDDNLATISQGLLCGVCGQHNYISGNDDFTVADGTNYIIEMIAGFPHVEQAFYDHYVQVDNPPNCITDRRIKVDVNGQELEAPACVGAERDSASKRCAIIKDDNGPFKNCRAMKDRQGWHDACVTDICIGEEFACQNLANYADMCGNDGPVGPNWRNVTNCGLQCGVNQVYSTKIHRDCVPTCADPLPCGADVKSPDGTYTDGCACIRGHVWNGEQCIPQKQCKPTDWANLDWNSVMNCLVNSLGGKVNECQGLPGGRKVECLRQIVIKIINYGVKRPMKVPILM